MMLSDSETIVTGSGYPLGTSSREIQMSRKFFSAVKKGDLAAVETSIQKDPGLALAVTRDGNLALHVAF